MPEYAIGGIPILFPFEPYDVQRRYMEKVIECLDRSANSVLESPTGTGKTLSLLCSTLGWVLEKKRQVQVTMDEQLNKVAAFNMEHGINTASLPQRRQYIDQFVDSLNAAGNSQTNAMLGVPRVIYASRTHSQISQAMQELKRTGYNHMKAAVIGSRDQLCIHPDLAKESNANKIQLCKIKVTNRSCHFHNRLDTQKDNPEFRENRVLDIEELVRIGKKLKCCPYYASKEFVDDAEIIFMPYNYLLDPKMRKANKIDLQNTIIILDEAHNVEKMCEESASAVITSTQIALAIEDVSHILNKMVNNDGSLAQIGSGMEENAPDFTVDDLTLLKEIFLNLEKTVDEIKLPNALNGETFTGGYIFSLLEKANITQANVEVIIKLLDTLIIYLTTDSEASGSVFRRGAGLQYAYEFLQIAFSSSAEDLRKRMDRCYKVYIEFEPQKQTRGTKTSEGGWMQTKAAITSKPVAKIVSFWCFSPGFGMQHLLGRNVRSIILTSGTLAPLKPLISELDIPISVQLENPHIIKSDQVCVKIIGQGSDKTVLNSNYQNRDNMDYILSLGRTIASLCPVIPGGLLVFFPSYFVMNKCKTVWQEQGVWSSIDQKKQVFVEPQTKEAFVTTMTDYYAKINAPNSKGAIFMAVCRGKVSEGLDFADMFGRAVIITGLPYPPFKDPKVILKKKYLNENRTRENELLSGDDWYFLEASRAVNQAIGRVIRHKNDYGAILLCDTRFHNPRQKGQLSRWIQGHLNNQNSNQPFGQMIGELARFFRNAEKTLPQPGLKPLLPEEMPNESKGSAISTATSGPKYKMSTETHQKVREADKSWNNVPKANEAFCLDMYKHSAAPSMANKSVDLFSGLNQTVKSINFNNVSADNSPQVTIHKRNRNGGENISPINVFESSPNTSPDSEVPKKKKYKMVPNSFTSPPPSQSVLQTTASKIFNSMTTNPAGDHKMNSTSTMSSSSSKIPATAVKSETTTEANELPKDRKDLLKFIKNTISNEKYKIFLQTFIEYNNKSDYKSYRDNLLSIFCEKQWFFILRGMIRFTRSAHRQDFQKDVEDFIRNIS
ncbi:regulator of telomere elongation helicase 1 homolog [Contarinia nasturtii]|uniref:regulator of telomere elongation helicase 1 homolog n=1 Tax=Contarinia nasturtii TaxID=265458 RepID=UPI0012D3BECD|nr:regulator of telomere elongation helicase 1 homolog [Contarinia nasturtii]